MTSISDTLKEQFANWIDQRTAKGIETYGQLLPLDDGRDNRLDMIEELLDFCQYQQKELMLAHAEAERLRNLWKRVPMEGDYRYPVEHIRHLAWVALRPQPSSDPPCPCITKGQPVCDNCKPPSWSPAQNVILHGQSCLNCDGEGYVP